MAENVTLHDLVDALANAVAEAQDNIERFQTHNVKSYFDENHRPQRVVIRLPSLTEPKDEVELPVPLLALVNATRLAIKDVEISMDVRLGSLSDLADAGTGNGGAGDSETPKPKAETKSNGWGSRPKDKALMLDMSAPKTLDSAPHAKVTLRVESQEPTEGMSRLLVELNKRIGITLDRGGS